MLARRVEAKAHECASMKLQSTNPALLFRIKTAKLLPIRLGFSLNQAKELNLWS